MAKIRSSSAGSNGSISRSETAKFFTSVIGLRAPRYRTALECVVKHRPHTGENFSNRVRLKRSPDPGSLSLQLTEERPDIQVRKLCEAGLRKLRRADISFKNKPMLLP